MQGFDEYQYQASRTAVYPHCGEKSIGGLIYTTLGLTGEAGELANKLKKILRDRGGVVDVEIRYTLAKELGDVLWYVAMLAQELDYDLSDIARLNIENLQGRQVRGTLQGEGDNR